jgi:signal transduction histidine kinase
LREDDTALISHDLRNPLSIIMAAAHRLQRAAATPGGGEDIGELGELIASSAGRMRQMLEEMVEAAYLESAGRALANEPVSMGPLVRGTVEQVDPDGRTRVIAAAQDAWVEGDQPRLERVVANLLSNALKYSTPGTPIDVQVSRGNGEVVVSVSDQGRGIPAAELPHLFKRFYRVQRPAGIAGHGLGLYISALVIEARGGWIKAASVEGAGSTFSFGLPALDLPGE